MRIVLLGAPGAGKGTQAKRLAEKYNLSSGDILRAEKASGSPLGRKVATYMVAGKLVPDEVVVEIMAQAVAAPRQASGLLLDGFPRTVPQAQALDAQLDRLGTPLDRVVMIDVSEDVVVDRICGRRSCPKCGAIYHVTHLPPKVAGRCDQCGYQGQFEQRDDDTEPVVRQRLGAYRKLTAPLLEYYRRVSPDKVLVVDGNRRPDEVTAALVAKLAPAA
jgi:adenylate kinase